MTEERNKDTRRADLALYRRCRWGAPDALRALIYRNGDYWYTAALMVCGDEQAAAEAVRQTWAALAKRLSGWRFGGGAEQRAEKLLWRVLAAQSSRRQATEAIQQTRQMAEQELIAMPEALAKETLEAADSSSETIAQAYELRERLFRGAALGAAAAAAFGVALLVWAIAMRNQVSMTQVAWGCVQERVVTQDVPGAVLDVIGELDVGEEAAQGVGALQQAGLVLEEIANAGRTAPPSMMGYLADRSRAEDLAERVQFVAERCSGEVRVELMRAALILEEVENW